MSETQVIQTPVGDLEWIFITGQGKKDPKGNSRFTASVVYNTKSQQCKDAIALIKAFWDENKPGQAKKPKSLGYRELEDEAGNKTGRTSFNFWTGITFQDGTDKKVQVFNAKGAEVSLGSKRVGNGSVGRIKGAMGIYKVKEMNDWGVTLYLNGVQLQKFVEFTGGVAFDEMDDAGEDDFLGFDDGMDGLEDTTPEAVPNL